jgi:hypothetical protein
MIKVLMVDVVADTVLERFGCMDGVIEYDFGKMKAEGMIVQAWPDGVPVPGMVRVTPEQREWFLKHCVERVNYFHKNWKKQEVKKHQQSWKNVDCNAGRDWVYLWVTHWAVAFLQDPVHYIMKHSLTKETNNANNVTESLARC